MSTDSFASFKNLQRKPQKNVQKETLKDVCVHDLTNNNMNFARNKEHFIGGVLQVKRSSIRKHQHKKWRWWEEYLHLWPGVLNVLCMYIVCISMYVDYKCTEYTVLVLLSVYMFVFDYVIQSIPKLILCTAYSFQKYNHLQILHKKYLILLSLNIIYASTRSMCICWYNFSLDCEIVQIKQYFNHPGHKLNYSVKQLNAKERAAVSVLQRKTHILVSICINKRHKFCINRRVQCIKISCMHEG